MLLADYRGATPTTSSYTVLLLQFTFPARNL